MRTHGLLHDRRRRTPSVLRFTCRTVSSGKDPHGGNLLKTYDGKLAYLVSPFLRKRPAPFCPLAFVGTCHRILSPIPRWDVAQRPARVGEPVRGCSTDLLHADRRLVVRLGEAEPWCSCSCALPADAVLTQDFGLVSTIPPTVMDALVCATMYIMNR